MGQETKTERLISKVNILQLSPNELEKTESSRFDNSQRLSSRNQEAIKKSANEGSKCPRPTTGKLDIR